MIKETGLAEVVCPYCSKNAELIDSARIYKNSYGFVWICFDCNAYVGVHKYSKSFKPLGTLAKKELRVLRNKTHKVFDRMWKSKRERTGLYNWLSIKMNIPIEKTHIGMFNEKQCNIAIKLLTEKYYGCKQNGD